MEPFAKSLTDEELTLHLLEMEKRAIAQNSVLLSSIRKMQAEHNKRQQQKKQQKKN